MARVRWVAIALCAAGWVSSPLSGTAWAGPDDPAPAPPSKPSPSPATKQADSAVPSGPPTARSNGDVVPPSAPTPPEWQRSYEGARAKMLAGDFASAALLFAELERTATNDVDRSVAHAQRTLADEWTARGLALTRRSDLGAPAPVKPLDKRTTDEIVSLYVTSVLYGAGSGTWVASLTHPDSAMAAVLPVLALTGGAIGTVMALDDGRGLRYGVAQSIVTGTFIGLEHGLAWTFLYNQTRGTRDLDTGVHATIVWGLTTVGAVGGGLLGSVIRTTPGRSAWVGSTTLWSGALLALTAGAVSNDSAPFAAGGIGLTAGIPIGLLSAGAVSPSISRVRLLDVSGVVGGLLGAGIYAGAVKNDQSTGVSGSMALGVGLGLLAGFAATSSMGKDRLRPPDTTPDETETASLSGKDLLTRIHPLVIPSQYGGAVLGVGGPLD